MSEPKRVTALTLPQQAYWMLAPARDGFNMPVYTYLGVNEDEAHHNFKFNLEEMNECAIDEVKEQIHWFIFKDLEGNEIAIDAASPEGVHLVGGLDA